MTLNKVSFVMYVIQSICAEEVFINEADHFTYPYSHVKLWIDVANTTPCLIVLCSTFVCFFHCFD